MFKRMINQILDAVFPRACVLCDELLPYGTEAYLCSECAELHPVIREAKCKSCGQPLEHKNRVYCHDCYKDTHHFDMGRALWPYADVVKDAIYDFKYHNKAYKARGFADCLAKYYGDYFLYEADQPVHLIVPVPLHPKRKKERGYNQAALLAKYLSSSLQIPYDDSVIIRNHNTPPLKTLTNKERRAHIVHAFDYGHPVSDCGIINKNILLIDDIYTTGTTADAVARYIKSHGAPKVYVLCIAIGRGYS